MLKRAFNTHVRPLLECNSVLCSPYFKQDIVTIERVQRTFSKRLPGLIELTYEERLTFLGWPATELRRLHRILTLYGIIKFCLGSFT